MRRGTLIPHDSRIFTDIALVFEVREDGLTTLG